jgi:hypothetical protein
MEFKDLKDVLTFAAFRPEADNPRFTWPQRFPNRKSTIVNVGRGHCTWSFINRKGGVESVGESEGDFIEVASVMADQWNQHTDDGWVGISLNNRFIISLEHNLSRKKGWEDELRLNPKIILGSKYDRTKRYAIHHSHETSASLMMACDDSIIKSIEDTLRTYGLRPARVCSGLFAMTSALLNKISNDPAMRNQDLIIITWVEGSLCLLRQRNGQWQDMRCRSGLSIADEASVSQMITPFIESADANTRVVLMEDRRGGSFSRKFLPYFANLHCTDLTEDHQLWNLLAKG